jgi:peptidoglycan/LPS O-acetylase OafA/YrhL
VLSVTYAFGFQRIAETTGSAMYAEIGRQFPGQLSYFIAGAFFYYFLSIFEKRVAFFLVGSLIILGIDMIYPLPFFEPIALGTVVVFFSLFAYVGNFGKYGDFSYGIYIVHFPIIQLLCQYGIFREQPWYFLVSAVILTGISSVLMWHLVEKRFLLRSSHYISASKPGSAVLPSFPNIADQKAEQDLS